MGSLRHCLDGLLTTASGCSHVACQIQRQHRIRLPPKFQSPTECVVHPPAAIYNHSDPLLDVFARHQVEKPVPVEQLTKCRMQDNLEFLQWTKKYWDQHYPGGDYDPVSRRKASGAPATATGGGSRAGATSAGAARRGATPTMGGGRPRVGGGTGANASALQQEVSTQKEAIGGLEKERDFYFAKLRDIELLLQSAVEADPDLEKDDDSLVKHIQNILYSTEVSTPTSQAHNSPGTARLTCSQEGFEIPAEAEGEAPADELETF